MMRTASYFTYAGPGRVGISLGQPRGVPAGFRMYRRLAPSRDMLRLPYDAYRARFFAEVLAGLDAQAVHHELHRLAAPHEPVLLCFERPPFTADNWCHRRVVSEWFADRLGLDVPELT